MVKNREQIARGHFDLVIVDEAHRLRNHQTLAWKFVSQVSSRYLLLLTATPVQNDLRELYNLVTLLRPGTLGTYRAFRRQFMVRGDKRLPKNTAELVEPAAVRHDPHPPLDHGAQSPAADRQHRGTPPEPGGARALRRRHGVRAQPRGRQQGAGLSALAFCGAGGAAEGDRQFHPGGPEDARAGPRRLLIRPARVGRDRPPP